MKIKELYKKIKKVLWDINCFCYRLHYNNRLLRTKNKTLRFSPTWFKYLYQDFKYGCNESDTWDITKDVYEMLLPRLKMFRNMVTSYPIDFESNKIGFDHSQNSMEEWKKVIDIMIKYVEYQLYIDNGFEIKNYKKAEKLFFKYFNDLWW